MHVTPSSVPPIIRSKVAMRALFLAALLPILASPTATPATMRSSDVVIGRCIARAAGGRHWLEKTLWGLRDQEGGWIGAEIANANGSNDLGPLQINSWWVPKIAVVLHRPEQHVRSWLKSDACFNVDVARWLFLSALRSTGDYWKAIGVYHSPTGWRQKRYALSVADHLTRRFGPSIFSQEPDRGEGVARAAAHQSPGLPDDDGKQERTLGFGVVDVSAVPKRQDQPHW